jgi:hypothetical protein
MYDAVGPYQVEQRVVGDETRWIAIRARGAEWSYLTAAEAFELGRQWVAQFGRSTNDGTLGVPD